MDQHALGLLGIRNLNRSRLSVIHGSDKDLGVLPRLAKMRWNRKLLTLAFTVNNLNANAAAIEII